MTTSTSELITELGRHIDVIYKSRSTTLHVKAEAVRNSNLICFLKDVDGRMVAISKAYEQAYKIKQEDYEGKFDWDVWGEEVGRKLAYVDEAVRMNGEAWMGYEECDVGRTHYKEIVIKVPQFNGLKVTGTFGIVLEGFLNG